MRNFENEPLEHFNDLQIQFGLETTFRALRQIAESLAGVPGRKSLIWVTGGIPFTVDDPESLRMGAGSLVELYESTWNALNHSQITVYPLDMGGLFNPGYISPRLRNFHRPRRMVDTVSNLETFAKMTGGKLCEYKLSLAQCFDKAEQDNRQYYMLGYYAGNKGKPGWRSLDVKVNRANLQIRARTSYYLSSKPKDPKKQEREDMDSAIVSPVNFTSVPMLVRWTGRAEENSKIRYKFRFNVAPQAISIDPSDSNLISIAFAAFAKTANGGIAGDFVKDLEGHLSDDMGREISNRGVVYDGDIAVPPGRYMVRFIVRDNLSGRLGSVSVPLEASQSAALAK